MKAFKIVDVKDFMKKLLLESAFDNFLLVNFDIKKDISYSVTGDKNADWFDNDEDKEGFVKWGEFRPVAAFLVKGNRTPLSIKAVFKLNPDSTMALIKESGGENNTNTGLFINIGFEKGLVTLTTGASITDFTIMKTLSSLWDTDMSIFLKQKEIAFEEL